MKRIRIAGMALVAMFVLSAALAATASAAPAGPVWKVEGAELLSGEESTFKSKQTGNYELKGKAFGFISITITCKKAEATGHFSGGSAGTGEATVKYKECSAGGLCTVTEPIEVEKAKLTLGWILSSEKWFVGMVWKPKTGSTVFVTIKCGSINANVEGDTSSHALNSSKEWVQEGKETEATKGFTSFLGANTETVVVNGTEESVGLTLEGNPSTLKGESEVTLTSGGKFGVFK
jgi:hypothetical protein